MREQVSKAPHATDASVDSASLRQIAMSRIEQAVSWRLGPHNDVPVDAAIACEFKETESAVRAMPLAERS